MNELREPVTEPDALRDLCLEIEGKPTIALDTEFTRYRTYRAQLELLQIATDEILFCIDASCAMNWSYLRRVFDAPGTTVVIHSAVQDLEVLQQLQLDPKRVVDSQIAAQICGAQKLSYQNLVKQHLDVSLPKDLTRSDWSKRPLSSQQIRYALDDVRYVLPLYRKLLIELGRLQRLDWFEEDCRRSHQFSKDSCAVENAWKTFRAGAHLSANDQQIAKKLLIWREKRAQKIDRPRQWVLTDQQISDLVQTKPRSKEQTARQIGLRTTPIPHWISGVQSILQTRSSKVSSVIWKSSHRLTQEEKNLTKEILDQIKRTARQYGVAESLLCTRQEALDSVRGKRNSRIFCGWRKEIVGRSVDLILNEYQ